MGPPPFFAISLHMKHSPPLLWQAGWVGGVGWLGGWVGWLAGWLVGWLVGWLAGWLVGMGWYIGFDLSLPYR